MTDTGDLASIRRTLLDLKARRDLAQQTERDRIAAVRRDGRLAVSAQQRFLWFLHQLAPETPTYNEPRAWRLRGELDVAALREALRATVARHESQRTRFGDEHGVPYQVIDPPPDAWPLPVHEGTEAGIADWLDAGTRAPFDLRHGPLLRTSLLRIAPDEHVLLLVWHHIIIDGWSMKLLVEEIAARYAAAVSGAGATWPAPAVQPVDHAAWQRRWLDGDEAERQIGHWRTTLAGLEPLDVPTDRPRPARPTGAGATLQTLLPRALADDLRALARAEGVSLLAVLLAGFQAVLGRYTGQRDIALGTVMSGRTRPELEPMAGMFANTVVVRGRLDGDPTFRELAHRGHDTLLEAIANQDVPFGTVVERLEPERLPGRNPLFQHVFTLVPAPMVTRAEFSRLAAQPLTRGPGTSRFELSVQVTDAPEGDLEVWIEYSTEVFDADRIERLVEHFTTLLTAAVAAPGSPVDGLELLGAAERAQVLTGWNPPPAGPGGGLLHELVAARVSEAPDRVAMRFAGRDLTYGELDRRANRLAHVLTDEYKARGRVVAVLLERGFGLPVAELGALKAGAAWLALDPQYPAERLAYQLADADAAVVVSTADLADRLPADTPRLLLDAGLDAGLDTGSAGVPDTPPAVAVEPEDTAYVIYTSGSTGRPKGVMVPHRAIVNFTTAFGSLFGVTPADRVLQFSNPAFDVSVSDIFSTLTAGATIVGAPRAELLDPEALQRLLAAEGVSIVDIPPPVLGLLDPQPLTALRILFIGMEPFGAELVNRWSRPGREFHNGYGPTEVTVTCVDYRCPDTPLDGPPPIGRAMANQRAYVLDRQLRPVPIGVDGELHMAGAGLAHGYLGRPDLTADKFLPDPFAPGPGERMYATGDLVRWNADGQLEFRGRVDRQVKLRGLRVELGEVEHVLAGHPGVRQTAVVVKEPGTPRARLIGYLVAEPGAGPDLDAVRAHATERLPLHMIPAALVVLDALPLTPTGKLDQARLPDPEPEPGARYVAPDTDKQRRLAEIWQSLLGLDDGRVGTQDSFFALGGNSLQVTQLISRIRDAFQVTLEPRQLFTHPLLGQLAVEIEHAQGQLLHDDEVAALEAEIAELSEEELDRLLGGAS
ncbi:amino acid adenylation domain-containing protein [Dactylosporangium sp. NPDC051485]|uniref:amino acid adenylation domain-containing protein n=1 Tax=Dactylosporangium sp. NPDC051485 TaxID=3154846 RepID=UPI0034170113